MVTPFSVTDYLSLQHRPDLGLVTARWTRPVGSAELRAGYQEIMRYASGCDACRRWLIDARRRVEVDARDVHWLTDVFYPTLRQQLNGHVFLAFLIGPHQADDVRDETLPPLPYTHGDNCSVNQFTDEGEAVRWLVAQR